ncbi:MAG TPA: glycosyltransferase [Solirubrobacterales bacterium]
MIRLPSADDPAVSLIVLLDGAVEMAERCLKAIAATDDAVPSETVILLNDPDPALEDLVRKGTTGGHVIVSRANAGPGVGWNLGAAVARAPRLATLHEDSEPDAGWLAPLYETMTESGAGAVGSRLYNRDGTVQNCGWVLFSDASHQQIREAFAPEVVAASEPTPADVLSGAAMLLDRDAVRAAGGWDERFHPAVFVDIDISTAIWNQGRPVLSVPASTVCHQSGAFDRRESTALTGPRLRAFLFERHRHLFLAKWGPAVRDLAPPPPDAEPESVKAAVQAALPNTWERAEQVRSGSWKPPGPTQSAERPHSGVSDPVRDQGDGTYAIATEVEEGLNVAERELVADYCGWVVRREEAVSDQLAETQMWLHQSQGALADLQGRHRELERRHQELAVTLDRILHGITWRLRTLVHRMLQRARHPSRSSGARSE